MTDNFDRITEYFRSFGKLPEKVTEHNDYFFDVLILRRGKDHPELPAANYTYGHYYYDNIERFIRCQPDIKKMCEMFKSRAYVSATLRSKEMLMKQIMCSAATIINNGGETLPWNIVGHSCDIMSVRDKRWVVDVDNTAEGSDNFNKICEIIRQCDSEYEDPIITTMPTKSGVHLITHPFNLQQFNDRARIAKIDDVPEVKKNHITLLYENV